MPRLKRKKVRFSRNISTILIVVRLIFSRNVEGDRAVGVVLGLSPQNAFGAPLFSDIGIFGIFATESSSPHTIYSFEVWSDFLVLSKWRSFYGVYKNGSVHRSLHRTWFSSWSWIKVFSINLYRFCRLGGRTGAEGVVPPFSEIQNFSVKYRECLYFLRVFSTGSDEIFFLTRNFQKS